MNKVKLPLLTPDDLVVLSKALSGMLTNMPSNLDEKCIFACLAEFYSKVSSKLIFPAPKNKISITMAQAVAFVHTYKTQTIISTIDPYSYSTLSTLADEMNRQIL